MPLIVNGKWKIFFTNLLSEFAIGNGNMQKSRKSLSETENSRKIAIGNGNRLKILSDIGNHTKALTPS